MDAEILDWTLHNYLHNLIEKKCTPQQKISLKSLRLCGNHVLKSDAGKTGIFVLSNGNRGAFFGLTMCKNPFACPCCSAHRMATYSAQIGVALDELQKQGYIGFMMTFTIPHLYWMKCREVTDILYNTYSYYRRTMKQTYKSPNKQGTISSQFYKDCHIEHSVIVCEYTHGQNGWHPHFHGIFWTKKENADKILKWEKALNEFWMTQAKRHMKKYFAKDSNLGINEVIDKLFERAEPNAGIYISKQGDKLAISKSSDYVCGWGADREVTGNYRKRASAHNHRTPHQILEDAYSGDADSADLYIDFCLAVTRKPVHHRVIWSRTGIKKLIIKAEQIKKAREYLKKKETAKWSVICWFTCEQWYNICDATTPHRANILYLASRGQPNLVYDYLDGCGLEYNKPESHYLTKCVEDIYNAA